MVFFSLRLEGAVCSLMPEIFSFPKPADDFQLHLFMKRLNVIKCFWQKADIPSCMWRENKLWKDDFLYFHESRQRKWGAKKFQLKYCHGNFSLFFVHWCKFNNWIKCLLMISSFENAARALKLIQAAVCIVTRQIIRAFAMIMFAHLVRPTC